MSIDPVLFEEMLHQYKKEAEEDIESNPDPSDSFGWYKKNRSTRILRLLSALKLVREALEKYDEGCAANEALTKLKEWE